MRIATELYDAYRKAVGGKSAITGTPLPDLSECPSLVISGWCEVEKKARDIFSKPIDDVLYRNSRGMS